MLPYSNAGICWGNRPEGEIEEDRSSPPAKENEGASGVWAAGENSMIHCPTKVTLDCLGLSRQAEAQKDKEVHQLSPQGSPRSRICGSRVHGRVQQVAQPAAPEVAVLQDLSLSRVTAQWLHVCWFHALQCPKYINHAILSQCLSVDTILH